jgi:hypothetical protein
LDSNVNTEVSEEYILVPAFLKDYLPPYFPMSLNKRNLIRVGILISSTIN